MRDDRIDIIRGIAVTAIAVNHIATDSPAMENFPHFQFGQYFSFNFADVFLFFSGVVCGLVYAPAYDRGGESRVVGMASKRVFDIWLAQFFCALGALAVIFAFDVFSSTQSTTHGLRADGYLESLLGSIFLYDPIPFLGILPLYIFFLLLLPLAIMLAKISSSLLLAISVSIWAIIWLPTTLAQAGVDTGLGITAQSPYFMHPMAAQLLFFTGVCIGIRKDTLEAQLNAHRSTVISCALGILIATIYLREVHFAHFYLDQKPSVGPLRLLDLLALTALISVLSKPTIFKKGFCGAFAACGRNSLAVFSASTVMAFALSLLSNLASADRVLYAGLLTINIGFCLWLGVVLEERKIRQKSALRLFGAANLRRT